MVGGISGVSSYSTYYTNMNFYRNINRTQGAGTQAQQAQQSQNAPRTDSASTGWALRKPSQLGTPVQPVDAVKPVNQDAQPAGINLPLSVRQGADPAEMAVRMRMQPYTEDGEAADLPLPGGEEAEGPAEVPDILKNGGDASELGLLPGKEDAGNADLPAVDGEGYGVDGAGDAQKAVEDGKCETCEKRKYQDGSDDMSVSFQTPTNIKPENVASAVRGHEQEHVVHEQAKAQQEDRKVVSQSVTLHTDICPECGKVYISGGETRTVTKANPEQPDPATQADQDDKAYTDKLASILR